MYGATKYRSLAVKLSFSWFNFFEWSSTAFSIAVSLFLCAKVDFGCCWFVVQNRKIPSDNGNLLLRFEELTSKIILSLPIDRIECLVLNSHSDSWVVCLFISPLIPLRPVVGLRPPSKIPSFSYSDWQSLLQISTFCPEHNTRIRSLLMLVLSHSDTRHLNRHMVGCGCHEIVTPCSRTVLFSTTFLLISMSRVEDELIWVV